MNINGGTLTSATNLRVSDDGPDGPGSGVLNMTGGVATMPNFLLIGHGKQHERHLQLVGGTITAAQLQRRTAPQAMGTVNQTGGFVNNSANLVVAEISRRDNLYDLSGGTLRIVNNNSNGSAFIGSSAGIGTLRVRDNGNAQIDGHIFVAGGTTAFGTFSMSGGTVALGLNKPEGGFLVLGEFGQATATSAAVNSASTSSWAAPQQTSRPISRKRGN